MDDDQRATINIVIVLIVLLINTIEYEKEEKN